MVSVGRDHHWNEFEGKFSMSKARQVDEYYQTRSDKTRA